MRQLVCCFLFFVTVAAVPSAACATDGISLKFFNPGKTVVIRASDLQGVLIEPESDPRHSTAIIEITPETADRIFEFSSTLIGKTIAGFVDGKVWFSGIRVYETLTPKTLNLSGLTAEFVDSFPARVISVKDDAALRDKPFIVMFEEVGGLELTADDILEVNSSKTLIEVKISALLRPGLLGQIKDGAHERWHLAFGGYVIGAWEFVAHDEFVWLKMRDFDQGAFAVARSYTSPK